MPVELRSVQKGSVEVAEIQEGVEVMEIELVLMSR